MAFAAVQLGANGEATGRDKESRQLGALRRARGWLNFQPPPAMTLSGKVVLAHFGTYTCINWMRTLPYVRAWARRYGSQLAVIGIHTPEFAFEHDVDNVRRALQQMQIDYPIAIDNDYAIWRAFDNQYWPALYIIDVTGRVAHHQFGEGGYQQSEAAIKRLLAESGVETADHGATPVTATGFELPADWRNLKSPENYLGHDRTYGFSSPGGAVTGRRQVYALPRRLELNRWAAAGDWTITNHAMRLNEPGGRIAYRFHARDVHLVSGPATADRPVRFRVSIDGQPPGAAHGFDVDERGNGNVVDQRLYQLVRQPGPIVDRTVEIEFLGGVEAFSFTFG